MSAGDIHNHNGSICKATKKPCPFGAEGHSKDVDSFVEYQARANGVDGEKLRSLISDGVPLSDSVEIVKSGLTAGGESLQKVNNALVATPEGNARFQAYREQWSSFWEKIYNDRGEDLNRYRHEALANRDRSGTYDGAWVQPREDGSMEIPAGDYVLLDEGIFVDEEEGPGVDAWQTQALATTPPGTVGGSYLLGEPAYFLTSASMGDNHGYDGEALIPRMTYDRLVERGAIDDTGASVQIKKDTVLYGELGNPSLAPEKAYSWTDDNRNQYWDEETMDLDEQAEGTIRNHPFIVVQSND